MKQTRANRGGQTGMNGEWYEGGQFIANTEKPKMSKKRTAGSGKQEIAPFVWEVPAEGMVSLYDRMQGLVNVRTGQISKDAVLYYGKKLEVLASMLARWQAGERWITIEEAVAIGMLTVRAA